jgi:hypothetical protein
MKVNPERSTHRLHLAAVTAAALLTCGLPGVAAAAPAKQGTIQKAPAAPQAEPGAPQAEPSAKTEAGKQLPAGLAHALRRDPASIATTQWADGTVIADLSGTYMNVWIARVNPDGSLSHACVTNADEAANALSGQPALEVK